MIGDIIAALIGNYMTTLFVVGLIVGAVQILKKPQHQRTPVVVSGILLNTFIFYAIGCAQAVNFVMHSVFGDFAARSIGWEQSPFQLELAFASLGMAVIAFIVYGRSSQLRAKAAVVIAMAIFGYGAAGGHVYQMMVNSDFAANNTGLLLVMDFVIPTFGLAVLVWHVRSRRHAGDAGTDAPRVAAQH